VVLGAAAVGTEHLGAVSEKAAADQRRVATVADEALAVPVLLVERNELRSTEACTHQHHQHYLNRGV